ncbi:MAG: gliding motility lipoprotein GldH [Bacteroidales bacterium]|jgi:hypothetical protein|nr:gliding motility lipoprotein GldH [Bacteroidales bacterium]
MEQSVAVDSSINQTFVYECDNDKEPHTVFLTLAHNEHINFLQLVVTFSHSKNGVESFAVPIGIPLRDKQGNFVATKIDSVWKYEIPLLTDTYFSEEAQSFTFTSDEGRILNGIEEIGIRIER